MVKVMLGPEAPLKSIRSRKIKYAIIGCLFLRFLYYTMMKSLLAASHQQNFTKFYCTSLTKQTLPKINSNSSAVT